MATADAPDSVALAGVRAGGLVPAGEELLVLLSGGADSTCLLDVALRLGARVSALHVNYGLRAEAEDDELHCRDLCRALGVELEVVGATLPGAGNLQAQARDIRYAHAERGATGSYATAHTRSDQAETVLYRLAVSPGRRALLGMAPRRGRLVRPLLGVSRSDTESHCRERGLSWREDSSNADPRFARSRIRHDVLPVLRDLNPGVERTLVETSMLLRDEAEVLDRLVEEALAAAGGSALSLADLRSGPPALARLLLRRLAEGSPSDRGGAHPSVPLSRADADRVLALGGGPHGGSASLDVGGGLRAMVEYGWVRFTRAQDPVTPEPVELPVPGVVRFGSWRVEAAAASARVPGPDGAPLDPAAIGAVVLVRPWREGDSIRVPGLGGSKSLADLFGDAKVPRALRRTLPVVEASGELAWVAGLAVSERFTAAEGAGIVLSARRET